MTYNTNTTTNTDELRERTRALVVMLPTPDLVGAVRALEAEPKEPAVRLVQSWMMDELEHRFPSVVPALDAWAEATVGSGTFGQTYVEALLAALPEGVAR